MNSQTKSDYTKEFPSGSSNVTVFVQEAKPEVTLNWTHTAYVSTEEARNFLNALRRALNYAIRQERRQRRQNKP